VAGLDVSPIEGYNAQRREYLYNQIVKFAPELANTPDLLYGDLELIYIRMLNDGKVPNNPGDVIYVSTAEGVNGTQSFVNAISYAKARGISKIKVAAGRYVFTESLVVDSNLEIECDEGSTLDFRTANLTDGCIVAKGGDNTSLPAIASDIVRYGNTITFASSPNVKTRDLLVITNPTDYSFSSYRSYYKKGEIVRVASVSGNTVTVDAPIHDNYLTSETISVYKMSPITFKFKGGKIIGKFDAINKYVSNIQIQRGYRCSIENLVSDDAPYAHVALMGCFDSFIEKLNCLDYSPNVGLNYAVAVVNSQKITIDKVHARTTRHAITLTGGGTDPIIVNRDVKVLNSQLAGIEFGLDMHGNTEKCEFINNTVYGGMKVAGNRNVYRGNKIYGHVSDETDDGAVISFREIKGLTHTIENNELYLLTDTDAAIKAEVTESVLGGNFKVNNNSFYVNGINCTDAIKLDIISSMTASPTVEIKNNTISNNDGTDPRMSVEGYAGHTFGAVTIEGNKGVCIRVSAGNYKLLKIHNNETIKAKYDGILVALSSNILVGELVSIKQNTVLNAGDTGVKVTGTTATTVIVDGNTSLNANQNNTTFTDHKASVYANTSKILVLKENIWGDTQTVATQVRLYSVLNSADFALHNNVQVGNALGVVETSVTKRTEVDLISLDPANPGLYLIG